MMIALGEWIQETKVIGPRPLLFHGRSPYIPMAFEVAG